MKVSSSQASKSVYKEISNSDELHELKVNTVNVIVPEDFYKYLETVDSKLCKQVKNTVKKVEEKGIEFTQVPYTEDEVAIQYRQTKTFEPVTNLYANTKYSNLTLISKSGEN